MTSHNKYITFFKSLKTKDTNHALDMLEKPVLPRKLVYNDINPLSTV